MIGRGFSTYLDATRAVAALVVFASHLAYSRFTGGDYLIIRDYNLGSDAVVLFFVLSGFVVAYAADARDATGRAFLFSRATRLFSVAIPALILTLAADAGGQMIDAADYDGWWHHKAPVWETAFRALSFTSEWSGTGYRIGTNGPWWSLSYEAAYYLLFAAVTYLAGWRRAVVVVALIALIGVKPLLLAPAWLMGVLVYRATRGGVTWTAPRLILAAVLPVALYILLQAGNAPLILSQITKVALGDARLVWALRFSDEFLWNALIGGLFALHLRGMAGLLAGRGEAPGALGRGAKWLAGASFSIYLCHYPLLMLWDAALPEFGPDLLRHAVLAFGVLGCCLLFAEAFERPLPAFRRAIRGAIGRVSGRVSRRSSPPAPARP